MKPANKFRHTDKFFITGVDAEHIAAIVAWFRDQKSTVIGIGTDGVDHWKYTVRINTPTTIEDVLVDCCGSSVREVERCMIYRAAG